MRVHGNCLCEVPEMRACRILLADEGDDEEDEENEDEQRRHDDEKEEDEEEEERFGQFLRANARQWNELRRCEVES